MNSPRTRLYLDFNATAPLCDAAREAMDDALHGPLGGTGNPSSPHAFGHEARLVLEAARREVAALVDGRPSGVVFVSGGTEADNLAIQGVARARIAAGKAPGHIVTSAVEHPAVLATCRYLESTGWRLTVLPVDTHGRVDPAAARAALTPGTALVSIMAANNETGVLQPIDAIAEVTRSAGVPLHVDAVQAAGRVGLERLDADLISISSHKIGGPAGIGALCVREKTPLAPLLLGGGQERRLRAGSEAPILAAGFGAAARWALGRPGAAVMADLRDTMERTLTDMIGEDGIRINGAGAPRLPNTSSVSFAGADAQAIVIGMDLLGYAISTGSACSTGSARPSHVLAAMGLSEEAAASTIRVSIGPSTPRDGMNGFVRALAGVVAGCRPARPVAGPGGRR